MNAPTLVIRPTREHVSRPGGQVETRSKLRPWFLADWWEVTFMHYAMDPTVLQPQVPFPLDLFEGRAYVSAVAFTQANLRPALGGCLTRWITAPVGMHEFLNLRTYVVVDGRPGIYFLSEWISNRLTMAVGPRLYGLPLRLAGIRYANGAGEVTAAGRFGFTCAAADDESCFEARGGSLEAFLVERYTAYTHRDGVGRRFEIGHAPWRLRRATVEVADDGMITSAMPWFAAARFACAHVSEGVFGVAIGGPVKVCGPRGRVSNWAPLVLGVVAALVSGHLLPAWGFMWALAYAIYFGCKWLTLRDSGAVLEDASVGRRLGYLFAWPGMDARAFLARPRRPEEPPPAELSSAIMKSNLGLVLLYLAAPFVAARHPLLGGWVAMIGLILSLHFGVFDLLSLAWRSIGVDAKPLMNAPWRSKTLGEFWGRRWNRGFRELSHKYIFRPLVARVGATWAILLTFLASGLIHDAVISLPARGGYGLPTLYFLIQGVGLLIEKSPFGRLHLRGATGRLFTIALTALPAGLLFHRPFVERVILPFLHAIGAT